ncbi:MAG: hypothetical protein AAF962_02485 [Actinomycetota bacterium]
MIAVFVIGATLGLGLWLLLLGLRPPRRPLADRLADFHEGRAPATDAPSLLRGTWTGLALRLFRAVRSEGIDEVIADAEVAGTSLDMHVTDKLNAGLGGAVLSVVLGRLVGVAGGPVGLVVVALIGFVVCYFLPDVELRSRSTARRQEFDRALTGFVSLVAVSMAGGGGINTAMADAAAIGHGWTFELLGRCLDEAALVGEPPWAAMERAGRRLGLTHLVELSGSVGLAGASGARITESLQARAEADRSREIAETSARAEARSESMNVPIAALLLGWFGFMGYPAVANLVGAG